MSTLERDSITKTVSYRVLTKAKKTHNEGAITKIDMFGNRFEKGGYLYEQQTRKSIKIKCRVLIALLFTKQFIQLRTMYIDDCAKIYIWNYFENNMCSDDHSLNDSHEVRKFISNLLRWNFPETIRNLSKKYATDCDHSVERVILSNLIHVSASLYWRVVEWKNWIVYLTDDSFLRRNSHNNRICHFPLCYTLRIRHCMAHVRIVAYEDENLRNENNENLRESQIMQRFIEISWSKMFPQDLDLWQYWIFSA